MLSDVLAEGKKHYSMLYIKSVMGYFGFPSK